ncbi:dimethylarginine dimethylaminohydrolase family protein [Gracilibacillus alcaliphilus]|uniref:dimethylarginine dimethylaminohydrolase family protein n=1 Tax=Gracilibacillus alcaliphilus TaxID=1401441 RepID=UPI0019566C39|nr:arginine deiminase family protein [Gracilibacillus alcaliphilus]MBM7678486.1 N-dimethylarginine dimethylaminohydrolase [Gracilibacillus alcaliphilus]
MIYQTNEYAPLKRVITCPPMYMEIRNIINITQQKYKQDNIDVFKALDQYQEFVQTLTLHGAEVLELSPSPDLNEQVFTRDIGFTINHQLFTCNMKEPIRRGEISVLQDFLQKKGIEYHALPVPTLEGGDIVLANDTIYAGTSNRTTRKAIEYLAKTIPDKQVVPLQMREDILHLDCCFNLVSDEIGIIYPDAFPAEDLKRLRSVFELIEVSDHEQFAMGTNVLSLGGGKVIALPENQRINQLLAQKGFDIIEVPFSEIIKSGGSFRCCSLAVERGV